MPIALRQADDYQPWSGKDDPFSTKDQRDRLDAGEPFYILDAKTGMRNRDGEPNQIGFLFEMYDGDRFVMTMGANLAREYYAEQAQRAAANDDTVGPVKIELRPSTKEGYSPARIFVPVDTGTIEDRQDEDSQPL